MDITYAQGLARSLMLQHGIGHWQFALDRSKRRFGQCRYRTQTISMSRHLIELNSEDRVRQTLLHEIAHALTPNAGHGYAWQLVARQLGCPPVRCYSTNDTVVPDGRHAVSCGHCGESWKVLKLGRRLKALQRQTPEQVVVANALWHMKCGKPSRGKLTLTRG